MKVLSVNTSRAISATIDGKRVMTAIGKRGLAGPVNVQPLGLAGDEQANLSVHGGVDKAIYAYPSEHYPWWTQQRKTHILVEHGASLVEEANVLPWGMMGENLTLTGLLETDVFVGDKLVFPNCTLRVTEPREPCYKFAHMMGFSQAVKLMFQSNLCGFYLAVERSGTIAAGESFVFEPGSNHGLYEYGIRLRDTREDSKGDAG